MRFSVIFVRFGLPEMELDSLSQLLRATHSREWSLHVVNNIGNPETLTELWNRVIHEEAKTGTDVAVLLNSDCWVADGWTQSVMMAFADPTVAAVGPSCNSGPTSAPPEVKGPRIRDKGWPEPVDVDRAGARCAELACGRVRDSEVFGHCYAVRLSAFLALGGLGAELDAGYTLYGSEQAFSRRLRAAGYRTVVALGAYCYHIGEASGRAAQRRGEIDLAAERDKGRRLFLGSTGVNG